MVPAVMGGVPVIASPPPAVERLRVIPDAAHNTLGKHVTAINVAQRESVRIFHPSAAPF
jgi:hypothetical protein